ncbi:hypothetical protein [Brochothrix phage ADU4]|nr:hypothetical protein [Brochothrix phage ADU4]
MKNRGFCRLPTTGTRSPVSIGFLCCLNNLADHYVQLCLRVDNVSSHVVHKGLCVCESFLFSV